MINVFLPLSIIFLAGCAINNQPCEEGAQATVEVGSWLIIRTCKEETNNGYTSKRSVEQPEEEHQ